MSKDAQGTYEEREKAFLKELTKLSRKHGVSISGCGCCGSPSLGDLPKKLHDGNYEYASHLEWNKY